MSDREGYFVCELDFQYLNVVRGNMLCLKQMYLDMEANKPKKTQWSPRGRATPIISRQIQKKIKFNKFNLEQNYDEI